MGASKGTHFAHICARTPRQRRLQVACGYGGRGEDNLARYSFASFESYATLVELIICTLAQGWFPYTMQKTCFPSGELRHNAANQTQSQL